MSNKEKIINNNNNNSNIAILLSTTKEEGNKITTSLDHIQTSGAYYAREEALKKEVNPLH